MAGKLKKNNLGFAEHFSAREFLLQIIVHSLIPIVLLVLLSLILRANFETVSLKGDIEYDSGSAKSNLLGNTTCSSALKVKKSCAFATLLYGGADAMLSTRVLIKSLRVWKTSLQGDQLSCDIVVLLTQDIAKNEVLQTLTNDGACIVVLPPLSPGTTLFLFIIIIIIILPIHFQPLAIPLCYI